MKITNRHALPAALVAAAESDPYDRGDADYSVSDLITPPQIVRLSRAHADELSEDIADRLWSLMGRALHALVAPHAPAGALAEHRLYATIDGVRVSGQVDLYAGGQLTDYKVTSVWSRVYGSRVESWTQQLNLYSWLLRQNGYPVIAVSIVALYRDWSRRDADRDRGGKYPKVEIETIGVPVWSDDRCASVIRGRVAALRQEATPRCTDDDTWRGRRCEHYCPAASVCEQYRGE